MRLAGLIGRVSEVRGFTMNAPVQMTADRLRRAMSLHQEGRHAEAQQAYREVLEAEPENFDALHLLGVAMAQTGRLYLSAELIGKAIDLNPRSHSACCNLALTLVKLGRVADALVHCDQAIALKSDYSEAHALRANA